MALTTTETDSTTPAGTQRPAARPRPLPELLLVIGLFLVYKLGRIAADGHVSRAFDNATRVWHLERILHLPSEVSIQHLLLTSDTLVHTANVYYAVVHFPATIAFLLWIYFARPGHYLWIRRLMAATTGLALAVHLVFPLAPPRMLPGVGLIDTAARYGPSVYGPPSTDTLSNQYAAMPSLHVGWALIVAIGLIWTTKSAWRWLWLLYPAATFFVVLGTANHYWLDGIAGIAIVAALLPVVRRLTPSSANRAVPAPEPSRCVPRQPRSYQEDRLAK
ncbi:MAG TPA: phosphatase PAP2 family protein [Micromonosporaceae bacterium]